MEVSAKVAHGMPVPASVEDIPPGRDVILVTTPLFHVSALQGAALLALTAGSRIVLLPGRFGPERVLAAAESERVTRWSALGSAAPRVAACPALGGYDTSSMRTLSVGGATVSPAVQRRLMEAFPSAFTLTMGYTSTEAGAVVARIGGAEYRAHPTSTGSVTPTVEIELRDPAGGERLAARGGVRPGGSPGRERGRGAGGR
jgi:acyl-CoA synthetase (AMP-forming)/AMP-acid ligase II